MNPIVVGMIVGAVLCLVRAVLLWLALFPPPPPYVPRAPMRDLRLSADAPTTIASEARKARGIQ